MIEEIVEMRKNGARIAEIAEKFGISREKAGKICTNRGIVRVQHTTQGERNAIIEARNQGESIVRIAEMFGRSEETVKRVLRNGNAIRRPRKRVQGTPLEDEICRRHIAGDKTISIIKEPGVARKTIEEIVQKHGIQRDKRERTDTGIDLDALAPRETFPVNDSFELEEEERKRLEEIRAAKIKNWKRLNNERVKNEIHH